MRYVKIIFEILLLAVVITLGLFLGEKLVTWLRGRAGQPANTPPRPGGANPPPMPALTTRPVSPAAAAALIAPQTTPTAGPVETEQPLAVTVAPPEPPPLYMGVAPGATEVLKDEYMYTQVVPPFTFTL